MLYMHAGVKVIVKIATERQPTHIQSRTAGATTGATDDAELSPVELPVEEMD